MSDSAREIADAMSSWGTLVSAAGTPFRNSIQCRGAKHHVRVVGRELHVLDHEVPDERALVVLGGDAPECLLVLDAWNGLLAKPFGAGYPWQLLGDEAPARLRLDSDIASASSVSSQLKAWNDDFRALVDLTESLARLRILFETPRQLRRAFVVQALIELFADADEPAKDSVGEVGLAILDGTLVLDDEGLLLLRRIASMLET